MALPRGAFKQALNVGGQLNDLSANTGVAVGAVKYVTNVESYDRRIQSAINIQGRKMQRRAEFLLTRALRQAGWR